MTFIAERQISRKLKEGPLPETSVVERLEFHISSICDRKCIFCCESRLMDAYARNPISYSSIVKTLVRKRREGCNHVTFTGGEPTLHPQLPNILKVAKKLGYRTYLNTDGFRLANEDYAERVLPLLDEMCVSVHGDSAAVHDLVAADPGSFGRVMKALDNISKSKTIPYLLTNTVVTRLNINQIVPTIAMLTSIGAVRHCIVSNVAPEGAALKNYEDVCCRIEDVARLAAPILEIAKPRGIIVHFFGVPICLLGENWRALDDLHWSPRVEIFRGMVGSRVGFHETVTPNAGRMKIHTPKCSSCDMKDHCFGIFKEYYDRFGDEELKPIHLNRGAHLEIPEKGYLGEFSNAAITS